LTGNQGVDKQVAVIVPSPDTALLKRDCTLERIFYPVSLAIMKLLGLDYIVN